MLPTHYEQILWRYCDLLEPQLEDLQAAGRGELTSMNGARHFALADLIGPDYHLTPHGQAVLERARGLLQAPPQKDAAGEMKTAAVKVANQVRKHTSLKRLSSCHVKLMWSLHVRPGLSWKALAQIFSYQAVYDLSAWGLAQGETRRGAPWQLTDAGQELVRVFFI